MQWEVFLFLSCISYTKLVAIITVIGRNISHKTRLEKEGFFAREEMDTTCCYAVQDKFWVTDPDGNEWEFFYTKLDSEVHKIEDNVGPHEKSPSSNSCY